MIPAALKCLFPCIIFLMGQKEKTVPEGTSTQIQAAVSEDVLKHKNGEYLDDCGQGQLLQELKDDIQEKLFEYSQEVTGVSIEKI